MGDAPSSVAEPATGAGGGGGGGAVRRSEREVHAQRRWDGGVVPSNVPALVPVHAPTLVAPPVTRPPAAAVEAPLDEEREDPADEERGGEHEARGGSSLPLPPPAGGAGARVQRTSLPELFVAIFAPDREEAGGLLVEDDAATLTSGQMRKGDFMRELRVEVRRVAEEELRRAGRTAEGCPYIDEMLAYYEGRSAEHLERAIRRYAPATRQARDARDYVPILGARLGQGIARWVTTGQMPEDVPNEALAAMAGARNGLVGAIAGVAGLSAVPRRKGHGPEPDRVDGGALVRQLGPGQPLDGTTRGRMERALGHSFDAVRIHADEPAAALSRDLAARAFTIGPHVAFGAGQLAPGTPHGDALLAHELAHVVQQGTSLPAGEVPLGAAGDQLEHDADLAATAAVTHLYGEGQPSRPAASARERGLRLDRCNNTPAATAKAPQPDPAIERYITAMGHLRRNAPGVHALIALAPLDGASTLVFNYKHPTNGTMEFFLQVSLANDIEASRGEAVFLPPAENEIQRGTGTMRLPMRFKVTRSTTPTMMALVSTLYREGIRLRSWIDSWIVNPQADITLDNMMDPQTSRYQLAYIAYKRSARNTGHWRQAVDAWSVALAGTSPPTDAHRQEATGKLDELLRDKLAFDATRERFPKAAKRTNRQLIDERLPTLLRADAGTVDRIAELLVFVFDYIDEERRLSADTITKLFPPLRQTGEGWRTLAEAHLPFARWPRDDQRAAEIAYDAVMGRDREPLLDPGVKPTKPVPRTLEQGDDDRETIQLLRPYEADLRTFREHLARISVDLTPPKEARSGTAVTVRITVRLPDGRPAPGVVQVAFYSNHLLDIWNKRIGEARTGDLPLTAGVAEFTNTVQNMSGAETDVYSLLVVYPDTAGVIGNERRIDYPVK